MTAATASRYCSRNIDSPIAVLNDRPFRLWSNQSGRGYDPVMAVGSFRSRVTVSICGSCAGTRPQSRSGPKAWATRRWSGSRPTAERLTGRSAVAGTLAAKRRDSDDVLRLEVLQVAPGQAQPLGIDLGVVLAEQRCAVHCDV